MTNTLTAGDPVPTNALHDSLPIGTEIVESQNYGRVWRRLDSGQWIGCGEDNDESGPFTSSQFSHNGNYLVVQRLPTDPVPPPPPQMTLRQYQWKFRQNALAGGMENGISTHIVTRGLAKMGLDQEWELGPGVVFRTGSDMQIPVGTLVASVNHADPKDPRFTIWSWRNGRGWSTVLGRLGIGRELLILEIPGVTESPAWVTEVGHEHSETEILAFKATAWRIGMDIKRDNSWCTTFEHILGRVGVTHRSLTEAAHGGRGVGARVTRNEVAGLPVNTLLVHRHEAFTDHWAIYRRDDSMDNATRTRRIAGHANLGAPPLGNYQSSMTVLTMPIDGSVSWEIPAQMGPTLLETLPVGTRFTYGTNPYVIAQDRLVRPVNARNANTIPVTGTYQIEVFRMESVTITSFEENNA